MSPIDILKAVILFLDLLIFLGLVISVYKAWHFRPRFTTDTRPRAKKTFTLRDAVLKERWNTILEKTSVESLDSLKLAIIELDKLVDDVLKRLGLTGQHMADRIEELNEDEYHTLWRLWRAHRLRNNVVHNPGFVLTAQEAQEAIDDYKAFLEELEVL